MLIRGCNPERCLKAIEPSYEEEKNKQSELVGRDMDQMQASLGSSVKGLRHQ